MAEHADIVIVGAGAAGLMAGIWAGRTLRDGGGAGGRVVLLDGAKTLGAKILVAGGGRCNVTHHQVSERDFCGSTPAAIRKVLSRFDVGQTVAFFRERGVELKREETGKLFPVTDSARTVLDALLTAVREVAEIAHPQRVERIEANGDGGPGEFVVAGDWGELRAARVILATGGMALPKTGSDGFGLALARRLGHTVTTQTFPALVPLKTGDADAEARLRELSGIAADCVIDVVSSSGKRLARVEGAVLCTHFGLSGPGVLDISRHLTDARFDDPGAGLVINWLPGQSFEDVDRALQESREPVGKWVAQAPQGERLATRLAMTLCDILRVDPAARDLRREQRRQLAHLLTAMPVEVTGDRGYKFAEAMAGGVPLKEVDLKTMQSRVCTGLHLCGEMLDVDGRIGGFNFQWAWASGFVAGCGAGAS